ncbi:Uncharacterized protein APZ42_003666, partial [Daphnia magna]
WKSILPELKETARLCDIHFEESDIVKGFKNGQNFHPLQNWRLLKSAIPKFVLVKSNAESPSARKPLKQLLNVTGHNNRLPTKRENNCHSTAQANARKRCRKEVNNKPIAGESMVQEIISSQQ